MRNPYEVLGVDKSASQENVQKAYHQMARKYHPDMHQEEDAKKEAQEKFKEVATAFEILGNTEKRAHYDRFGQAPGRNPFSGNRKPFTSPVDDFFNNFFHQSHRRQSQGESIFIEYEITLDQVLHGGEADVKFSRKTLCSSCKGLGGETATCPGCQGTGAQVIHGPAMSVRTPCQSCGGEGVKVTSTCTDCEGGFSSTEELSRNFKIPQGVEDGMRFAFRGQGQPCPNGINGDVVVVVRVKPHDLFERMQKGVLLYKTPVTYTQLVLGVEIEVPTLDGPVMLKVPAGTKSGQEFRLKEKGLPSFNGRRTIYQRGDQLVRIELDVPTSLTEKYRQLIEELAQLEQIGD